LLFPSTREIGRRSRIIADESVTIQTKRAEFNICNLLKDLVAAKLFAYRRSIYGYIRQNPLFSQNFSEALSPVEEVSRGTSSFSDISLPLESRSQEPAPSRNARRGEKKRECKYEYMEIQKG
jgi:hypothetical protein